MKLHLKDLCREFGRAKNEETVPSEGVNPYLLENVLWPALHGKAPTLREINYEQFDLEDIGALSDYYDNILWITAVTGGSAMSSTGGPGWLFSLIATFAAITRFPAP